jgi:Tfp pilus assembly protein PilN
MQNPTLKILAVVSFIIMLFGVMCVYLAVTVKHQKTANEVLTTQIDSLTKVIENCK